MNATIEVITQRRWVTDELARNTRYDVRRSFGLDLPTPDPERTGWWMPTEHAARLRRQGVPMTLIAPGADWLGSVPAEFRRSTVLTFTVDEFLGSGCDSGFVKSAEAKIETFPAGWRTPGEAVADIRAAGLPGDALIQWCPTRLVLSVEYRAFVLDQRVVAMSVYLEGDVTYYDMGPETLTAFSAEPGSSWAETPEARRFAGNAVRALGDDQPPAYCLDVGYDRASRQWVVIEANPAWCSAWYGCADDQQSIDAVADTIVRACTVEPGDERWVWQPDAYPTERAARMRPLPMAERISHV